MLTTAEGKVALRQRPYRVLLTLGPGCMGTEVTGTVQSTLVDGVEALESYMRYYLPQSIVAVAVSLAVATYICAPSVLWGQENGHAEGAQRQRAPEASIATGRDRVASSVRRPGIHTR